jgi:mono/diheme cytochrome c family protein
MTSPRHTNGRFLLLALLAALPLAGGCRQRMSDQPYYRPLEHAEFFADGRASRPLERGTIHRAQRLESDPIATGLTHAEWERSYEFAVPMKIDAAPLSDADKILRAVGAPRYDQRKNYETKDGKLVKKATLAVPEVYVEEYPFPITHTDLKRGQDRYTIYCAVCHGPLGNGQGKIWERGYLAPTSFHTNKVDEKEVDTSKIPPGRGISRGYALWNPSTQDQLTMKDVPVGYIFEVITKGYGGMPSYSAQIKAEDRWKIVAYIRVLQMSQGADAAKLSPEIKKLLEAAGGNK